MRKVFSSNVTSQTMLVCDALERDGLDVTVQNLNESLSPIPGFAPQAEIWVMHDADYEHARKIVNETIAILGHETDAPEWVCEHCNEANPPSFDICWKCGADRERGN